MIAMKRTYRAAVRRSTSGPGIVPRWAFTDIEAECDFSATIRARVAPRRAG
jgi:hypothetical protein